MLKVGDYIIVETDEKCKEMFGTVVYRVKSLNNHEKLSNRDDYVAFEIMGGTGKSIKKGHVIFDFNEKIDGLIVQNRCKKVTEKEAKDIINRFELLKKPKVKGFGGIIEE